LVARLAAGTGRGYADVTAQSLLVGKAARAQGVVESPMVFYIR
jgi:hypothetical protein